MFRALDISTSGLVAQRHHLNTIAGNIANVNTTRNEKGESTPFQRRIALFEPGNRTPESQTGGQGVRVQIDIDRQTPNRIVHDPGHVDADEAGNVQYPNVNIVTEFVNALQASRAYEANVASIEVTKNMISQTLRILG
jgi:flagellar basal-body rod protein FlgC